MACTAEVVPPTIKKAWAAPKALAASSSASLITLTGMAEVVQRLHGVDVHAEALLAQELRQLGVAAAALVARHVKGHKALRLMRSSPSSSGTLFLVLQRSASR